MNSLLHVSGRQHAGVILLAELASAEEFRSLQEIATSMALSQGYLEEIASAFKQAGLVTGRKGPRGGYRLTRRPEQITMEEVVVALEGPLEAVPCHGAACPVQAKCETKSWWDFLRDSVRTTLKTTTLADILNTR